MAISVKTKVRENASTAEMSPLESAVNIPACKNVEAHKEQGQGTDPVFLPQPGHRQVFRAGRRWTPGGSVTARETSTVAAATAPMIFRLVRTSFLSFSWFCSP